MPYRRNTYDFVVDSGFTPFTMSEMLVPFTAYKDAFEKSEVAYDDLRSQSDKFKYLSETLPEGSKARQLYEGYANDLKIQADDLAKNGLNMGNRRALTSLKQRYQGEIGRLTDADTAMQEEKKLRRQMNSKDSSLLYAVDNLNIDDFLDNNTPNLYSVSGDDLYKRGAQAAASASSRIYDNTQVSDLTKYYQEITQRQGYSPELLAEFRGRMEAIPELQQAVDSILQEKGVNDNLSGINYQRARESVINGILDGAVYKEARSVKDNPGVLTAAQAASNALGWANHNESVRQHNLQLKMNGYDENGVYHPENDQALKKAEAVAKVKGTKVDANGNPITSSGNTSKVELLENESYNTDTRNSGPAPSGQNATYGQEISSAEAMALAPDLVAATGQYTKYYKFYKNGKTVTRRRIHSSVSPDEEVVTTGGTETGNGSNHNAL